MRWAEEERGSGELYSRLSREAAWHASGKAGLWDDPELELGLRWLRRNHPTAAWARRYDEGFDRAMAFLDASERERTRQRDERRSMRIRRLLFAGDGRGAARDDRHPARALGSREPGAGPGPAELPGGA